MIDFLLVTPSGEMSNFLIEDFEAVVKFMNTTVEEKLKIVTENYRKPILSISN